MHFVDAAVRFAGMVLLGQKAGRGGATAGEQRELVAEAGYQIFWVPVSFPILWTPDLARLNFFHTIQPVFRPCWTPGKDQEQILG